MSNTFQFKQFTIAQDMCAMKVGTDSVLLGAWLTPKEGSLLDIGSGTGLLSLMMVQRTQDAIIDAIDIDESAYIQTLKNIEESPWGNRITAFHSSIQSFETDKKYDLIFTNPPYFIDSSQSPNSSRNIARHNNELPFKDLLKWVKHLLKKEGIFALILPINEAEIFINEANQNGFYLSRKCSVKPNLNKPAKRILMEFTLYIQPVIEEEIIIEIEKRHQYTKEYINLTQDFYLNF